MVQQSFVFDMTLIETFWDNWNRSGWYGADSMTASKSEYQIILADSSSANPLNNVSDAIENGALKSTVTTHSATGNPFLIYGGSSGSWERTIKFNDDCTIVIGDDNLYVKGIFIRHASTKKVIAYCILSNRILVTNYITIPKDAVCWRILENVRYGE